jgi:hypothetical protein
MKGQSYVFQFLLFFIFGVAIFTSIGTFFNAQYNMLITEAALLNSQLLSSLLSAYVITTNGCMQCDSVNVTFQPLRGSILIGEVSVSEQGITVTFNPGSKSATRSIHNLNATITEIASNAFTNKPITLFFSKVQNILRVGQ